MAALVEACPSPRDAISEVARNHGYERLKEEQLLAIEKFVSGSDVFVSLPTGFGKSLIYGLLPAVFDRLKGYREPTSVALIVSPLASLMIDQKARFLPRGISAEFLGEAQHDARALQRVICKLSNKYVLMMCRTGSADDPRMASLFFSDTLDAVGFQQMRQSSFLRSTCIVACHLTPR